MSETVPVWEAHRPPSKRMMATANVFGLAFGVASFWFIGALRPETAMWLKLVLSIGLGILVPVFVGRGAWCQVDTTGVLHYGFIQTPNIKLQLQDVTELKWIERGWAYGVGLAIDPEKVQILSRKGMSYKQMGDYQREFGCAVLLEHLTQADMHKLNEYIDLYQQGQDPDLQDDRSGP